MNNYSSHSSYIPQFPSSRTEISNFINHPYPLPSHSSPHYLSSSPSVPFLPPTTSNLLSSTLVQPSFLPPPLSSPPHRSMARSAIFSSGPGYNTHDLEELYILLFDKLSDLKRKNAELELSLKEVEKNVDKKKSISKILTENELWSRLINEKNQEIKEIQLTKILEQRLQRLEKEKDGLEERKRKLSFQRIFPKLKHYYEYEEAMKRKMREEEEEVRRLEEELRAEERRRRKEKDGIVRLVREKGRMMLDLITAING